MSDRTATSADVAEAFEVSDSTVKNWIADGCPHTKSGRGKPNLFIIEEVADWLESKGITGKVGRPKGPHADEKAKLECEHLRAKVELVRMSIAEKKGELLRRADVEEANVRRITAVKAGLYRLRSQSYKFEGRSIEEIEAVFDTELEKLLGEYSRGK